MNLNDRETQGLYFMTSVWLVGDEWGKREGNCWGGGRLDIAPTP